MCAVAGDGTERLSLGRRERLGTPTRLFPFLTAFWVVFVSLHIKSVLLPKPSFPLESKMLEFVVVPHLKVSAGPPGVLRLCCNGVKSISPCKFLIGTHLACFIQAEFQGLLEELQNQGEFRLFQPFCRDVELLLWCPQSSPRQPRVPCLVVGLCSIEPGG